MVPVPRARMEIFMVCYSSKYLWTARVPRTIPPAKRISTSWVTIGILFLIWFDV